MNLFETFILGLVALVICFFTFLGSEPPDTP
jgi:hypothetical protein